MKNLFSLLLFLSAIVLTSSCKKDSTDDNTTLGGEQSSMGAVGAVVESSSTPIAGVSEVSGSVVSLSDGISSYSGSATITNTALKNILSNIPGITINGDNVTATGFRFRQTTEGIESFVESGPGIMVKYASNVGDTYPVGSTGKVRTVTSKSSEDDYSYGFYDIKVVKIEEPNTTMRSSSVSKTTYWANHKFGLVGVQWDFSDGSSIKMPVYWSATNGK